MLALIDQCNAVGHSAPVVLVIVFQYRGDRGPSLRLGMSSKQPFHSRVSFIQRSIELCGIFAAGFGHVWASAA